MTTFLSVTEDGEMHPSVGVDSPELKINGYSVADLLDQKEDTIGTKGTAFNKDFGEDADTVAEGDHDHDGVYAESGHSHDVMADGMLILSGQTIDVAITAPAAIYFDAGEDLWKQYIPKQHGSKKIPALYIGQSNVALNGAVIDLSFNGDILFIDDNGEIQTHLNSLSEKKVMGYRIGTTQFKVNYDEYDYRLKKFSEKIMGSDAENSDQFGYSVSISGDIAIVGTNYEDTGGSDAGTAYVFRYNGSTWVEEQKLIASDAEAGDQFGCSVSISGDVVVIGARGEDTGGSSAGAAYVFRNDGAAWVEESKLQASYSEASDYFGSSVSIFGDVVVVGASGEDTGGSSAGAAYVFRYDSVTGIWEPEGVPLIANDAEAGDSFGCSVSISGDVVVVGAYAEDIGGGNSGAVYVFRYDSVTGTWVEEQKLIASDAEAGYEFGIRVSISGDILVVGARGVYVGGSNAGAAYVFRYDSVTGTWNQEGDPLTASDAEAYDSFGCSVSISDDVAVIGAYAEDTGGSSAGAAYVFRYNGSTWVEEQKLMASDAETYDYFGYSVSMSGDALVVGAYFEDTGGSNAGAAYIFDLTKI